MTYKELQQQAKELGLPASGTKEELEASIQEAKANSGENVEQVEEKAGDVNTAIVYDGSREVRRYELDVHGESFIELAEQYASHRKYTVEFGKVEPGVICPSCGHRFHPQS